MRGYGPLGIRPVNYIYYGPVRDGEVNSADGPDGLRAGYEGNV